MIYYVIPARAGSKRIPRKNTASIGGLSLVERAYQRARYAALAVGGMHEIVISTDDQIIFDWFESDHVTVTRRPDHLCTDDATTEQAMVHAANELGALDTDIIVVVQPTSPLAPSTDLARCVAAVASREGSSAVAVSSDFRPTGSGYAATAGHLRAGGKLCDSLLHVVVEPTVDIDEPEDLAQCRDQFEEASGTIGIEPLTIVGEIGCEHGGNMERAISLVDSCINAGMVPKIQIYDVDRLVMADDPMREGLTKWQLSKGEIWAIGDHAHQRGSTIGASVFDAQDVATALEGRLDWLKIPSGAIGDREIMAAIHESHLPWVASVGGATYEEIETLIFHQPSVIMHCVPKYPTSPMEADLGRLRRLVDRSLYDGFLPGYSDHTSAISVCAAAISAGARWVEVHVTGISQHGPDEAVSYQTAELSTLAPALRMVDEMFKPRPLAPPAKRVLQRTPSGEIRPLRQWRKA